MDPYMQRAVQELNNGRQPLHKLIQQGRVVRNGTHYDISSKESQTCCRNILQDGSTIPLHLCTAKHIAWKYGVNHTDLLREADEQWARAHYGNNNNPIPLRVAV